MPSGMAWDVRGNADIVNGTIQVFAHPFIIMSNERQQHILVGVCKKWQS